jgi:hypothetical protein
MADFEERYAKALKDGILPGYALIAGDRHGLYSCVMTRQSRKLIV